MKSYRAHILVLFMFLWTNCYSAVLIDGKGYSFVCDSILFNVKFMSNESVRILSYPQSDTLSTCRLVVSDNRPDTTKCIFSESSNEYRFCTDKLIVSFDIKEAAFSFLDAATHLPLLKEKGNRQARTFTRAIVDGENCLGITQRFIPTTGEALYGLGQYQNGILNYRGHTATLLQANMDIVNPVLISTIGYGILWDNYSSSKFEDSENGFSFTSEVGDASDYYFIRGNNIDEIISGYRNLTGVAPMFGKWVFGFWQSKERYKSFDELKTVAKEYRSRNIPIDNIVQDWEYWGDKQSWNSLNFNPANFSNPKKTIAELHNDYNLHFMISVWPGFGPATAIYQSLDSIGALFDEPTWAGYKIFDACNPEAREIFWKYLKKGLLANGVDAWWMDATEPSFRDGFTQLKQEERTKSAGKTHLGSFYRYLNTYSLVMMKDLFRNIREESPDKRVFILTRSAFASQQQYATAVWSGDVSASWENMHKQLTAGLNLSMSGIPYWCSDTGGFYVTERDANYPEGLQSDDYKELYARWFQFSTFTPILRAHGTNVPREVWQFGEKGTPYYDNQVKYINLRYRLLPYIYSTAHRVTAENYTMLRGLAMDFMADTTTYNIDNSYMFGQAMLVRPIFNPYSAENRVSTYLPIHENKYWYDFWSGKTLLGGKTYSQNNTLDMIPIYIKAGSIIPLANVKQYTSEYPDNELEIRVYAGGDGKFTLYDDDGESYDYEKGIYSTIPFEWIDNSQTLIIGKRHGSYPEMADKITLHIKIYLPWRDTPEEKDYLYIGEQLNIKI